MAGTPPDNYKLVLNLPQDSNTTCEDTTNQFNRLHVLKTNNQIRWLQTILRNGKTEHGDFVFNADRLIRLVIEEALNFLPTYDKTVHTPKGIPYEGKAFNRGNCGVSLVRSGEAMEKSLRECCRSIRIGKMLIRHDDEDTSKHPKVIYVRLPPDIAERNVLLMYPLMNTGGTIHQSIRELKKNSVKEEKILICTLFVTPHSVSSVLTAYPKVRILTTEVNDDCALHFGERYFGTDK